MKKSDPLYYDLDINLSNIETFFSGVNILDYVAPNELISIRIETTGCDGKKHNDSNEAVIQDALNSISNDCAVPIFVEK